MINVNLRELEEKRESLLSEGEAITNLATAENRNLTKEENSRLVALYGEDGHGGELATLEAQLTEAKTQNAALGAIAARRASEKSFFVDDPTNINMLGGSPLSHKSGTEMSDNHGRSVVMLGSDDSMRAHLQERGVIGANHPKHLAGQAARAIACGTRGNTHDIVAQQLSTSNQAGGYLFNELVSSDVTDYAWNMMGTGQAGVSRMVMDSPDVLIANIQTPPTMEVKSEGAKFTESSVVFGQRKLSSYTIGTVVRASRELAEDAPNFPALFERTLAQALAVEVDRLTLQGTGSGEPLGVLEDPDTPTESAGTPAAPTWIEVGERAVDVRVANYSPNACIMNPAVHGFLQHQETGDGSSSAAFWKGYPPTLDGVRFIPSNNCPADKLVVAQWNMFAWGLRSNIQFEVSTSEGESFERHMLAFKVTWRGDFIMLDHQAASVLDSIALT